MLREKKDNLGTKQCCANVRAEGAAALAAERETTDPATGDIITKPTWAELGAMNQELQQLLEQLAAEQERVRDWQRLDMRWRMDNKELRDQLAAEREKVAMNEGIEEELREANGRYYDCQVQLAAEREAREDEGKLIRTLSDDVMQLSQQLAAERRKVATLADALKRILDALEHVTDTMRDINYPPLKVEPPCPTENKNA